MKIATFILCIFIILVSGCVEEEHHSSPDNRYKTIVATNIIENQHSFYDKMFQNDQMVYQCSVVDKDNTTYKVHYKSDCEKLKVGQEYRTERNRVNNYIILVLENDTRR
jgi:hypothetical protein